MHCIVFPLSSLDSANTAVRTCGRAMAQRRRDECGDDRVFSRALCNRRSWHARGNLRVAFVYIYGCRTACRYGGKNIAFHVNEGSTSFWLSLLVEFEDGDGDIGSMQLKQVTTTRRCKALLALFFFPSRFTCTTRPRHRTTHHAMDAYVRASLLRRSARAFSLGSGARPVIRMWEGAGVSFHRDMRVFVGM
jgi:hypothetical protein